MSARVGAVGGLFGGGAQVVHVGTVHLGLPLQGPFQAFGVIADGGALFHVDRGNEEVVATVGLAGFCLDFVWDWRSESGGWKPQRYEMDMAIPSSLLTSASGRRWTSNVLKLESSKSQR